MKEGGNEGRNGGREEKWPNGPESFFSFLVSLEFELRASHLLCRHSYCLSHSASPRIFNYYYYSTMVVWKRWCNIFGGRKMLHRSYGWLKENIDK
jgi:hypothetical protein